VYVSFVVVVVPVTVISTEYANFSSRASYEFATPYHRLFVTASHSAAFRRNLKTHCFRSAFTIL